MWKDHNPNVVLAETRAGNLELYEDNIGLHYDAVITDEQTVAEARAGKIKGMSFGMKNVVDTVEQRADALPLRKISDLDIDHITLVVKRCLYIPQRQLKYGQGLMWILKHEHLRISLKLLSIKTRQI